MTQTNLPPALDVTQLSAHLQSRAILKGISFQLAPGHILGLVGPNGSGKSKLIRCITGTLAPTHGAVQIGGNSMHTAPLLARQQLGFAPDPNALPGMLSVRQCLALCALARTGGLQNAKTQTMLAQSEAMAERLALSRYFDSFVCTLSLGTKQKLAVLIGLMDCPQLIVLDEVFNGLDPKSAYALKETLRECKAAGSAILLATHGLELAANLLDEMLLLSEGSVAAHWHSEAFQSLRESGAAGLELAIVRALDGVAD
jgi:ABC-2 type transport system ATP-binding protein